MVRIAHIRTLSAQSKELADQMFPQASVVQNGTVTADPFDATQSLVVDKPPLRVLQVVLRYFPYSGGTETHTYEVSRRLAQAGLDVTVLTTDLGGDLPRSEELEGVHIRRVRAWPRNRDYYFAPGLYPMITQGKWDVVHCQGVHTLVAPLAMLAAWRAKLPYVVTFHSGGHDSQFRNAVRGVQWSVLRPLLARAQRLIGVSKFEATSFQQQLHLPLERFRVIRNGSHLPQLAAPIATNTDETLIVSVGRLERYKGHQRIIAALPLIRQQCPNARLLILGSGPYELDLRRLIDELGLSDYVEIRMIPPGERQAMAEVLARASVMTLLSEYEAHPIAVMEALSLQCPVLVANTSGLQELADEGLARSIPLNSSSAEVAAAVLNQLQHPLSPMAVNLPTWDGCAAELQAVYRSVVGRKQVVVSD